MQQKSKGLIEERENSSERVPNFKAYMWFPFRVCGLPLKRFTKAMPHFSQWWWALGPPFAFVPSKLCSYPQQAFRHGPIASRQGPTLFNVTLQLLLSGSSTTGSWGVFRW